MEKYKEYIYCNQAHSLSSSSSTKIFCDGERLCSPCGYYRCFNSAFFNDHTYSILKRICHKIIKNHSRQRCRENYSVFDGGNSTIISPVFKGKKDGTDLFSNCMSNNREQKTEVIRVPGIIINGKGNDTWYENMAKNRNTKKPHVSGESNENNYGGGTRKYRKGADRDEKGKKNVDDVFENGPNKYNKEINKNETKELGKRKRGTDNDKDVSKKSVGGKGLDRNNYIDEKSWKNSNQETTEEKYGKKRESKAKQPKIDKNIDQREINTNEDKDRKNRTSKAKQNKIKKNVDEDEINKIEENKLKYVKNKTNKVKQPKTEKNVDKDEINKEEEKEGNYIKNRANKAKQPKIEKNVGQGELYRNDEKDRKDKKNRASKTKQSKMETNDKQKNKQSEINKYEGSSKKSGKNDNKRVKHNDDKDHKIRQMSKKKIGNKDKSNYDENYQSISKKKQSEDFVKKDRVYHMRTQHGKDKPERIYNGLVSKNRAKSKFKPGSGTACRLLEKKDNNFRNGIKKGRGSKTLANRKNHISKRIKRMPGVFQSCRYVRLCDILRVKLEERDLSRCLPCCLPYQPYISCSSYQFGLPCV